MSDKPYAYRTSDRRVIPWLLLGLVVIFGALYVAGYYATSDRIPRGTTVDGVRIGGLAPAAARSRLRATLGQVAAQPIVVTANGSRGSIAPASAGLAVDLGATVERAGGGRSWDPVRMWDWFAGGQHPDAVLAVDPRRLDRAVAGFADRVDVPPTEGAVVFSGAEADPTYPAKGIVVDRARAARMLRAAFLHTSAAVDLPTVEAEPTITKSAVSRAMDGFANPAMSGPVVVSLAGAGVQLQPEDFAPALSMSAVDGELRPRLDPDALQAVLAPKMRPLTSAAREASFGFAGGAPTVVPGRAGVSFDPGSVAAPFLSALTRTGAGRTVRLPSVPVQPALTTAAATGLGVRQRVSSFATRFADAPGRSADLARAARLVDGTLVGPGRTFSLVQALGTRATADGHLVGGGTEIATALFNAAFFAGLTFVEHTSPRTHVAGYPVGREALADLGGVDLQLENPSRYGVYLRASVAPSTPSRPGTVTVTMYSTKVWDVTAEESACVVRPGGGGTDVDVARLFHPAGSTSVDHRETLHTHYLPTSPVPCS